MTKSIGFLTSVYAKQSHTFMRQEVAGLRNLGFDVQTFSIREPAESEIVDAAVRAEHERTEYILAAGPVKIAMATLREITRDPGRFLKSLRQAMRVGIPGVKGRLFPFIYLAEASYLAGRLREKKIDHLHNHLGRNSASVAMLASILAEIPFSLTIHGPTEFDEPKTLALREKIHRSAFTVAISEYGRSQLCRWCDHGDWPKIHVVHCGIAPSFLQGSPPPPAEAPRLVSVGRLAEQKGQLGLVEAAGLLRDRGVPFVLTIVGDGPMREEIERLIASMGLRDLVKLAGWKDSHGVRQEILDARLMVLPSFAEGLPVVLMEALAMGRPVVSTYVAGIPELVRPGFEGWLVPAGSIHALADALTQALATSSDDLAKMGNSGSMRVAEHHNATTEASKLAKLIMGKSSSGVQSAR